MNNFYYQKPRALDLFLPDQWICCGVAHDAGTPERAFYLDYFAKHDSRGLDACAAGYEVVVVIGFFGQVAGRCELSHCDGNVPVYFQHPMFTAADLEATA